ncbi:hypothetical protein [Paenibacillus turpanensis]|uniref:hypothetical protein n=1 Tax=Paenibacillus turpanensis TaxID=2689078 RepID=UPI00140B0346|nr:hypothetical protein [Paenibacillus turpanensis]
MQLRECLLPITRDEEFKARVKTNIEEIEALLDEGKTAEKEIAAFQELTGKQWDSHIFAHYWRSISLDGLIEEACNPDPQRVSDITKEELVEIVRRLQGDLPHGETAFYLQLLEANVPMPGVSDLVYWDELEPEEIVERALAYEPIILPERME